MLNLHEIIELESKWKEYKDKQYKKKMFYVYIIAFILLILILIFLIYFAYSKGASELQESVNTSNVQVKELLKKKQVELEKEKILLNRHKIGEKKEQNKQNEIPDLNSAPKTKLTLNIKSIETKDYKKIQNLENKPKAKEPSVKHSDFVIKNLESSGIQISQKDNLESLEYLKLKYSETNSIYFALDISDLYYQKQDYENARKWALLANKQNNLNERSWILFAKSSYKLGLKEQAINSLNNFLKNNDSVKIRKTLELIKKGQI